VSLNLNEFICQTNIYITVNIVGYRIYIIKKATINVPNSDTIID